LIGWQAVTTDRPGIVWEMKCDDDPEAVEAAVQALVDRLSVAQDHRCIVSSFSRAWLEAIRPRLPAVPMALIVGSLPADAIAFCLDNALEGIHLDGHNLDQEAAQLILNAGLSLRSYTINTEAEARRLTALGASMIMTDFPEHLLMTR
jgi:glycerophosphoryl diester phosphodiesterase